VSFKEMKFCSILNVAEQQELSLMLTEFPIKGLSRQGLKAKHIKSKSQSFSVKTLSKGHTVTELPRVPREFKPLGSE